MNDILGYVSKTGHSTYFRETITPELAEIAHGGRKMWTPLVSAADNAALRDEVSGLRAARIAYAGEFPLNADGDPDVGSIHANIRAMKQRVKVLEPDCRTCKDFVERGYGCGSIAVCVGGNRYVALPVVRLYRRDIP